MRQSLATLSHGVSWQWMLDPMDGELLDLRTQTIFTIFFWFQRQDAGATDTRRPVERGWSSGVRRPHQGVIDLSDLETPVRLVGVLTLPHHAALRQLIARIDRADDAGGIRHSVGGAFQGEVQEQVLTLSLARHLDFRLHEAGDVIPSDWAWAAGVNGTKVDDE